jgi:hypothetical protein
LPGFLFARALRFAMWLVADSVEKVGSVSSLKIRQITNNTFDRRKPPLQIGLDLCPLI